MDRHGRLLAGVGVALLCVGLLGCAPDRYIAGRAEDFADIWDVGAGIGLPVPYVRAKLTDFLVMGAGCSRNTTLGWRGRYSGPAGISTEEQWGIPFVRCVEEVYADEKFQLEVETWGPMITKRWYPEGEERKLGREFNEKCWIGLSFTMGLAARFGLNPLELGDWIAGFFLIDPLADDKWVFAIGP